MSAPFDELGFDESLAQLRLQDLSEEMQKNVAEDERQIRFGQRNNQNRAAVPALLLEMHERRTEEWARRSLVVYRDVWTRQGNSVTGPFLMAAFEKSIPTVIAARSAAVVHQFNLLALRTGQKGQFQAQLGEFARKMARLAAKLKRETEIEAKTLDDKREFDRLETLRSAKQHAEFVPTRYGTPNFWQKLREEFGELKPKGRHDIVAHIVPGEPTALVEGTEQERLRFERKAERAMRELGFRGESGHAVRVWLERLAADSPNFKAVHGTTYIKGQPIQQVEGGYISGVCEASADYCLMLENVASRVAYTDEEENSLSATSSALADIQKDHQGDDPEMPSKARARSVSKIIKELGTLRPRMHSEDDYASLREEYSTFVTFEICDRHPHLKLKLENIQGHTQYKRFAKEIVAEKYNRKYSTIEKDWKRHNPDRKPRRRKPAASRVKSPKR
jgi:hypothetical protein